MTKFHFKSLIPPLFVQIYCLFILSLGTSGAIVYLSYSNVLKKNEEVILRQVTSIAQQSLLELIRKDAARLNHLTNEFGFTLQEEIPKDAVILSEFPNEFAIIKIFKLQKNYGFSLEHLGIQTIALKDYTQELTSKDDLQIWILLDFLVLLLTFAMILTLLHPLKVLQSALEEFGKGNYKIKIPVPSEPQQAQLAKSFNTMGEKISKLLLAREFVLRNIGHELKMPISKAKLALELMPKNPQKTLLQKCIHNLDMLTSQILTFEKVQEGKNLLVWENFDIETLLIQTLNQCFIEENELEIHILENFKICGDLQFLAIALKNLIENAKKYKSGGKIIINAFIDNVGAQICVSNLGTKLKRPIEYYLEPFSRDSSHALIQGYGLGLGIVRAILELHGFQLKYFHDDFMHHFNIIFKENKENL